LLERDTACLSELFEKNKHRCPQINIRPKEVNFAHAKSILAQAKEFSLK